MAAITKKAHADTRPLEGAIVRRITLGATTTAPAPVTLQSDGKWDPTNTAAAQLTVAVAIQSGGDGDRVDAVVFGPMAAFTGATPGGLVYGSNTAGAFDDAAGTKSTIVGYAESAEILFVRPQIVDLT
jgi:hypothetical protein